MHSLIAPHIRRRLALAAGILFLATMIVARPAGAQAARPNVVFILADDLGYGDIGAYGATGVFTPNIDQLAQEGARFERFYVSPSCAITRAMLMTGTYSPRISTSRNFTPSSDVGIHEDEVTLGDLLRSAGYATGIFGKWHLGDHDQFLPQRHGFDRFYGIPYSNNMWPFHPRTAPSPGEDPRLTAARDRAELTGYAGQNRPFPPGEGYPNLPVYDGDAIVAFNPDQETFGADFVDQAIDFIERNQASRFFAYVPLTAPHVPLHPAPEFVGTSTRDLYGDTVHEIDAGVGRILQALVALGIDGETLVIFLSDNGPWLEYGIDGGSAGPLGGGKEEQFEGGIRVPAVMRWPGQIAAGTVIGEPVSGTDVLPTLATVAGATLPAGRVIDGVDITDLVTGDISQLQREAIFSFVEADFTDIRLGAVISGDWKLHVDTSGGDVTPRALYDLASDIDESVNVMNSQPSVVSSLVAMGEAIVDDIAATQRPLGTVTQSGEPFAEKPGIGDLISMEAENYHLLTGRGGHNWQAVSLRHSSFDVSLQALPNDGTSRATNYVQFSPHLEYRIAPGKAARYYAWVRARGETGDDDSLHIGLNGVDVASGQRLDGIGADWGWTSYRGAERAYVDVPSAGVHTLDVWMREDGVVIDKIILTTDPGFRPYGKGQVESPKSAATLDSPPVAVDDGPYPVTEGASVTGNPNVLDNDVDATNDPLTASLVSPPGHAAVFELRPDGSFVYEHDGGASTADSFTYTAVDDDGTSNVATVTIQVDAVNDPPELVLVGDASMMLQPGDDYTEPGAIATDEEDGDLSGSIVIGGDAVDTDVPGSYVVTYDVTDSGGASAPRLERTVVVATGEAPVIALDGPATVNLTVGDSYADPGATATDAEDGDITANVVVGGDTVDTGTAGTYVVTYNVTDSQGNAAEEVRRTVVVSAPPAPPPPSPPPPSVTSGGGSVGWFAVLWLACLAWIRRRRTS